VGKVKGRHARQAAEAGEIVQRGEDLGDLHAGKPVKTVEKGGSSQTASVFFCVET